MKEYKEIKIYTQRENIDSLVHILENMGIEGFLIEDSEDIKELLEKKNSYDWDYVDEKLLKLDQIATNITFYQETSKSKELSEQEEGRQELDDSSSWSIEDIQEKILSTGLVKSIAVQTVKDEDWQNQWKEFFRPARVSNRIVVVPSWESYSEEQEEGEDPLIIRLDPGMAFGTGTHETTSLCLKLMEKYLKKGDALLDVGCGSGILTIGGALLGAKKVLGVDIDPEAVRVSLENVEMNSHKMGEIDGCEVQIRKGDLTKGIDFKADVIVANLMADLVMMLAEYVENNLKPQGYFISSGILVEKKVQVSEAITAAGFEIVEIMEDGEWCVICAKLYSF